MFECLVSVYRYARIPQLGITRATNTWTAHSKDVHAVSELRAGITKVKWPPIGEAGLFTLLKMFKIALTQ